MNNDDKKEFIEIMTNNASMFSHELDRSKIKGYFYDLIDHPIEDVRKAFDEHRKTGRFFPFISDLNRFLGNIPESITCDQIIAAARLKDTPLGVLARITIGSWDLDNQDAFYLKQRAEEVFQLLPKWIERARKGEYTDHEISIMLKHKVNPHLEFFHGIPGVNNKNKPMLEEKIISITGTDQHKRLMEKTSNKKISSKKELDSATKLLTQNINKIDMAL